MPARPGDRRRRRWEAPKSLGGPSRPGYGTEMAGIALYGDLARSVEGTGAVVLGHGLESVKILDGVSQDAASPRTYAEVTANAVATAEIEGGNAGPPRARVFSMAVTRQSGDGENGVDGNATLWSAALDALAAGTDVVAHDDRIELLGAPEPDAARLIVVSAGNVRGLTPEQIRTPDGRLDHLTMCDLSRIEEPAQAHNILAVGAFTELTAVPDDPSYAGFRPLAAHGQLSPFSRTSVALTGAPVVKPDIVMEGGNLLVGPGELMLDPHDVVSVTTTSKDAFRLITSANATSAATAQAARLAALAQGVPLCSRHTITWGRLREREGRLIGQQPVPVAPASGCALVGVLARGDTDRIGMNARSGHDTQFFTACP